MYPSVKTIIKFPITIVLHIETKLIVIHMLKATRLNHPNQLLPFALC
jgi:hypothetical protein